MDDYEHTETVLFERLEAEFTHEQYVSEAKVEAALALGALATGVAHLGLSEAFAQSRFTVIPEVYAQGVTWLSFAAGSALAACAAWEAFRARRTRPL
jgi:hypothetical protein